MILVILVIDREVVREWVCGMEERKGKCVKGEDEEGLRGGGLGNLDKWRLRRRMSLQFMRGVMDMDD